MCGAQDKLRNRTELAAQIDDKKRRKEQEKEAERAAAQEQQRRFEEWEKEKVRSGRLKMEKAARERREQDVLVQMVEQVRRRSYDILCPCLLSSHTWTTPDFRVDHPMPASAIIIPCQTCTARVLLRAWHCLWR